MSSGVTLKRQGAIATLEIQGRTHLNLLGPDVFRELAAQVEQCGRDESVRAIVLRGQGDQAFSAGVDLHEMKDLEPLSAERFIRSLHAAARGILNCPVPVVAAVHGPCLGGAFELALACDITLAADDAVFGLPEVRVGLPSVIEASLLPPTVGLGRARRMLLTGETIDAEEALSIGVADRVVSKTELEAAALEAAETFLGMGRYILAAQKQIVSAWLEMGQEAAAEYSIKTFALCFNTPYPNEAMTAFLEKRPPQFGAPGP